MTPLDWVFKSASLRQGKWTPSCLNSDAATLTGVFGDHHLQLQLWFLPVLLCHHTQCHPDYSHGPVLILSWSKWVQSLSIWGRGPLWTFPRFTWPSMPPAAGKAYVMRLLPPQLVLSSSPLSSSAPCILLPGGQVWVGGSESILYTDGLWTRGARAPPEIVSELLCPIWRHPPLSPPRQGSIAEERGNAQPS